MQGFSDDLRRFAAKCTCAILVDFFLFLFVQRQLNVFLALTARVSVETFVTFENFSSLHNHSSRLIHNKQIYSRSKLNIEA